MKHSHHLWKIFTLIYITILAYTPLHSQDISGTWNGLLDIQGLKMRLVFHITPTTDGFTSTLDSPDQGANGIPVNQTEWKDSTLHIAITAIGVKYTGKLTSQNQIVGTFQQAGLSAPLNLGRASIEKQEINRPQEPKLPYPYQSEDVTFPSDDHSLAGSLTLPKLAGPFPAVILISGSGPQNRDEEIMGHKPFLVLADYLTRQGIAVLRYDDRGTAASTGDFNNATTQDFANDAESALEYLQSRTEINKDQIGFIGHSEGGIIAPIVAARSKQTAFIVLLAGTGMRGDQLLLLQQEKIGKAMGISDSKLQKTQSINKSAYEIVVNNDNPEILSQKLKDYLYQVLVDNPDIKPSADMTNESFVNQIISQLNQPWMRYFISYDPRPILQSVDCPVLILNGEKDLQVPVEPNTTAIQKALIDGGNHNVSLKVFPNLNHLFQESETGSPSEYGSIQQTFAPIALEEIAKWINQQVHK